LKTPLAVIKGYYDLLLSGSLGKLTDKQRDICRNRKIAASAGSLVSMFLNYSALEAQAGAAFAGKRPPGLLGELATRWHEPCSEAGE